MNRKDFMLYFGEVEELVGKYDVTELGEMRDFAHNLKIRECDFERYCNDLKYKFEKLSIPEREGQRPTVFLICKDMADIVNETYKFVTEETKESWEDYKERKGLNIEDDEENREERENQPESESEAEELLF